MSTSAFIFNIICQITTYIGKKIKCIEFIYNFCLDSISFIFFNVFLYRIKNYYYICYNIIVLLCLFFKMPLYVFKLNNNMPYSEDSGLVIVNCL